MRLKCARAMMWCETLLPPDTCPLPLDAVLFQGNPHAFDGLISVAGITVSIDVGLAQVVLDEQLIRLGRESLSCLAVADITLAYGLDL